MKLIKLSLNSLLPDQNGLSIVCDLIFASCLNQSDSKLRLSHTVLKQRLIPAKIVTIHGLVSCMWKSKCSRCRVKYCTATDHLQNSVLSRFWNPVGVWPPYHLHKAIDMPYSLISSESLDTEMKDGRYHWYWIQKSNGLNVSYSHLNQHEGCCFLTCCCCGFFFATVAIVRLKINVLFSVSKINENGINNKKVFQ